MKSRLALVLSLSLALIPFAGVVAAPPSLAPTAQAPARPLVEQLLGLDMALPAGADAIPVLPIWSGTDGQLLAVVALPQAWIAPAVGSTPGYAGPSDWQLAGTEGSGAGLRWQFGNGMYADALLGRYQAATGCEATATCFVGEGSGLTLTGLLGLGWSSPEARFDLSYGLSWLQASESTQPFALPQQATNWLPALAVPGTQGYALDAETAFYAQGRWHISHGTAMHLGASLGRSRLSPLGAFNAGAPGLDLDQLSLSLGLDAGSLRGAIVGHVVRSDDPALLGRGWTALDLGISWRTPWSGELSVGAQNLWSTPSKSPREADLQGRTPYIQYRQDL
ncbi:hypothetical protein [Dokdonella sp.]|uniref:hypothetical protein n=1 Tax=Dokdonella sp. TaxID=2291710 RepID=UPI0031BEF4AB|nr:hypothetical protein [Dokdonella sp.]